MKTNRLLTSALIFCKALLILQCIILLVTTALFIHWHIAPDRYATINLKDRLTSNSFLGRTYMETYTINGEKDAGEPFALNKIKRFSLYLGYIQFFTAGLLILLILKEFISIITSVKKRETFISHNSQSFKKIGNYFLGLFFLSSFVIILAERGSFYGLYFSPTPLVLTLAAYILGEVFKEGNALLEEHNATI